MMIFDMFFMEVRLIISFLFRIIFISLFNDFNFTIIHLVTRIVNDFDIISLILFDLIYEGIVLKFSIIVRLIVVRWLAFVRIYENWLFDNDFLLNNHWFLYHNLFVNDHWFFHFKFFLNDNWFIDNNLFVNNNRFYNMLVKSQMSAMAMM